MVNKVIRLNFVNLIFASIGSILNRFLLREYSSPLKAVGVYKLVSKKIKSDNVKNLTVGVYKSGKRKYFVKTWHGGIKDFGYYYLTNEYYIAKILQRFMGDKYKIKTSIPVEIVSAKGNISAVYEFIEGDTLFSKTTADQTKIMATVLKELGLISDQNPDLRKHIPSRTKRHYYFSLFLVSIVVFIKRPTMLVDILKTLLKCIKLLSQTSNKLELAHKDLTPENIILTRNSIYLVDGEDYIFTMPGYDLGNLSSLPEHELLAINVSKYIDFECNLFYKKYLALFHLIGSGNFGIIDSRMLHFFYKNL